MNRFLSLLLAVLVITVSGCATFQNADERSGVPVAESQALAPSGPSEVGVATDQISALPQISAPVTCATAKCDTAFDVEPSDGGLYPSMEGFMREIDRLPWGEARAPPDEIALFTIPWLGLHATAVPIPDFYAPLTTTLVPSWSAGSGTPTFTRATTAYATDFEGKLNAVLSGEARFQGARREANVVATKSEDWTNAAWTKTIGTVTATTLTSTGANQTVLQTYTHASSNWVMRVRMSRITGTGNIDLTLDGGTGWTTVTLTGSNQVFSIAQTGVTNPQFGIRIVTSGDAINADRIAVYKTEGVTNTNPPEYVSVGVESAPFHGANVDGVKYFSTLKGNSVAANVVTEAVGAVINSSAAAAAGGVTAGVVDASGPLGYFAEGARTNPALQSEDFATTWAVSEATISTNAAVAPNGTTTADKVVETIVNDSHRVYQVGLGTGVAVASVWVKAGERTFAAVVSEKNGTHWSSVVVNLSTCAVTQSFRDTGGGEASGTFGSAKNYPNGWCRTSLLAGSGETITGISISPATSGTPVDGTGRHIYDSYAGDITKGIYVWGAQFEDTFTVASSYIPTTTIAVTRNADVLSYPKVDNILDAVGTTYAEVMIPAWDPVNEHRIMSSAGANTGAPLFLHTDPSLYIYTGFGFNANTPFTVSESVQKIASSWGNTVTVVALNGTTATGGFTSGSMNLDNANIYIGGSVTGASSINGTIRNVRVWLGAMSSAQLTTQTAFNEAFMPYRVAWAEAANDDDYLIRVGARR